MKKITILLFLLLCTCLVYADLPFRNHRYDALRVLPVREKNIVFVGNSITNMHEWWEAFGSNPNIINRGVSGAVTQEVLDNIECIAIGKPKKVFLMLGTNDLGTAGMNSTEQVLHNVTLIIECLQKKSPNTQIYLQSILPSENGIRNLKVEQDTNAALARLCMQKNITFIDLWKDLSSISQNFEHTLDGLHLKASGYAIWCKKIQSYVGTNSVYPQDTQSRQLTGGANASWGMRNTYFSMYPVYEKDILFIGDEMIHGGEWHELLQSARVKSRGTGWGYPGPSLGHTLNSIPVILRNGEPGKICLYAGVHEVNGNEVIDSVLQKYQLVVDKIKSCTLHTKIYLMGLQPTESLAINSRIMEFNRKLQAIALSDDQLEYIDLYTNFVSDEVANPKYFKDNYLYGRGYIKVAQIIADALQEKDIIAITDNQTENIDVKNKK